MEKDWSELSQDFDELQKYVAGEETIKLISAEIQKLKNLGEVLELGCGNGLYTQFLAKSASKILATDVSSDMVAYAKKNLEEYENIRIEIADAYKTGYKESSFDTIFMANLIHVVEHPDKLLQESKRILKQEGQLVISTFTTHGMDEMEIKEMFERYLKAFGKPPRNGASFTLDSLKKLLMSFKFEIQNADLIGKQIKSIFIIAKK